MQALGDGGETPYGNTAIEQSFTVGSDGFFIKSPKSFLGAKLHPAQLDNFQAICARMFNHIKATSESLLKVTVDGVVIGRPVSFHGTRG